MVERWNTSSFRLLERRLPVIETVHTDLYLEYEYNASPTIGGLCELAAWYHRSTGNETAPDQEQLICPRPLCL